MHDIVDFAGHYELELWSLRQEVFPALVGRGRIGIDGVSLGGKSSGKALKTVRSA